MEEVHGRSALVLTTTAVDTGGRSGNSNVVGSRHRRSPPLPDDPWHVRASHVARGDSTQSGASARASVQLDRATTLSSLSAYRRSRFVAFFDPDATELLRAATDVADYHHQFSEELTLVRRTPSSNGLLASSSTTTTTRGRSLSRTA